MMKRCFHSLSPQAAYRATTRSSRCQSPSFLLQKHLQFFWTPLQSSNRKFSTSSSSSSSSLKLWSKFFFWYAEKLDTHPFLTKGISCGIIAGMGDWMCQAVVHEYSTDGEKHWWDKRRTARFVILGTFLVAPSIHVWYGALAQHQKSISLFKRILIDQVLFCPSFLVVWLVGLWKLEELDPNHNITEQNKLSQTYTQRLVDAVPNLVVANWILWFPAQAINFGFVPVKFQVLFSNLVSLLWNGYLSFSTSSTAGAKLTEVSPPEETVSNPTGLRGRNSRISLS